jgi:hypothetical protein
MANWHEQDEEFANEVTGTKNFLCDYLSLLPIPYLTQKSSNLQQDVAARDACIISPESWFGWALDAAQENSSS